MKKLDIDTEKLLDQLCVGIGVATHIVLYLLAITVIVNIIR